jgi:hypothetical protein
VPVTLGEIEDYRQKLLRINLRMDPLEEELLGAIDDIYLDWKHGALPPVTDQTTPPAQ